jgi:hypothetical protein
MRLLFYQEEHSQITQRDNAKTFIRARVWFWVRFTLLEKQRGKRFCTHYVEDDVRKQINRQQTGQRE